MNQELKIKRTLMLKMWKKIHREKPKITNKEYQKRIHDRTFDMIRKEMSNEIRAEMYEKLLNDMYQISGGEIIAMYGYKIT